MADQGKSLQKSKEKLQNLNKKSIDAQKFQDIENKIEKINIPSFKISLELMSYANPGEEKELLSGIFQENLASKIPKNLSTLISQSFYENMPDEFLKYIIEKQTPELKFTSSNHKNKKSLTCVLDENLNFTFPIKAKIFSEYRENKKSLISELKENRKDSQG